MVDYTINSEEREYKPVSVNIAIWPTCNYRCKFCFGHYRELKSEFVYDRVLEIPSILSEMGTEKITIEGGEPFLCKCLEDFLKVSKDVGLTTSIVSNGSLITEKKLKK